ncbi:MAG: Ig-like domain-containing protein, partial [Candidatus Cryptobacteroides sp.]
MRNKLFIFSVLPAIFLSVASCQKEAETETVKAIVFTNVPAKGVQISEGETFDLTYAIEPASLQETAQINWVSDDKGIASVRKGRITGVSAGKTIVRAVCEGGVEATAQVQVFPLEVTDFKIPSSLTVPRDETVKVDVSDIVPEEASVASIEWSIADESIATWEISAGALYVTGLQNGTTTLTGEGSGIARTCKITVEYIPVTAVSVKAA